MRSTVFLPILLVIIFMGACTSETKNVAEEETLETEVKSECEGCPEALEIIIPDELEKNDEAKLFIKDAEVLFNKWSEKAYLFAKEVEEAKADTLNDSDMDGIRKGTNTFKLMAFIGEFMQEGMVMSNRMDKLKGTMSEEENEAFDKVWEQMDDQMEGIEKSFQDLGMDVELNSKDIANGTLGQ